MAMYYIGPHTHITGGLEQAAVQAQSIGATAFAMFTKNQRQWKAPVLTEQQITLFQETIKKLGFSSASILPHDSYLINLGSPIEEKRMAAIDAFTAEMARCAALGLDKLNLHPGSHLGMLSVDECLHLVADSLDRALEQVPSVCPVIETTSGQGNNVGSRFEEIRDIIGYSKHSQNIGVCIDTCHIFAAGYDIRSREAYEKTFGDFERTIGFSRLKGVHLNDAKSEFGSHVDRHESLGKGNIGLQPLIWIVQDRRFENIPLILETPAEENWKEEVATLLSYCDAH